MLGGGLGDGLQGLQGRPPEGVPLGLDALCEIADLPGGVRHQGAQALAALQSPVAEFHGGRPRLVDELGKLGGVGLGLVGKGLVVGLQRLGQGDQRRPLFGEAAFDGAHLLGDPYARGLQAGDVAGKVLAGRTGRVARLSGRGGDLGGPGCERRLGLAQLGFGDLGRLGHHPRLLTDAVDHARRLSVQAVGERAHFRALPPERRGELLGLADRGVGALDQFLALRGQRLAQRQQGLAGLLGRGAGADDLVTDALGHLAGACGGDDGGGQHVLGHGLGPAGFRPQFLALAHHVGGEEDEDAGADRQQAEHQQGEPVGAQRRDTLTIAQGEGDRTQGPKAGDGQRRQIDRPARRRAIGIDLGVLILVHLRILRHGRTLGGRGHGVEARLLHRAPRRHVFVDVEDRSLGVPRNLGKGVARRRAEIRWPGPLLDPHRPLPSMRPAGPAPTPPL